MKFWRLPSICISINASHIDIMTDEWKLLSFTFTHIVTCVSLTIATSHAIFTALNQSTAVKILGTTARERNKDYTERPSPQSSLLFRNISTYTDFIILSFSWEEKSTCVSWTKKIDTGFYHPLPQGRQADAWEIRKYNFFRFFQENDMTQSETSDEGQNGNKIWNIYDMKKIIGDVIKKNMKL